jgi:two-component system response regulator AgrA
MLRIFICEDDPKYLTFIKKQVENYITMSSLVMQLVYVDVNPATMLSHLEKSSEGTGMYFLGLHLGGDIAGIEIAESVRKYDPRGFIVFLASDIESYKYIFKHKIEALDYIAKNDPYIKERIHECLDNAVVKLTTKVTAIQNNYVFKLSDDVKNFLGATLAKDSMVTVDRNKILYFKTVPDVKRMVIVHTNNGNLPIRGSLKQLAVELDDARFYKCQSNLIINLDKVVALDPVQCILALENSQKIKIATRKIKELSQQINEYKNNVPLLTKTKKETDDCFELTLDEMPLNDSGEPDIPAILKAHELTHIDLSKAKIKVIKLNTDYDKVIMNTSQPL